MKKPIFFKLSDPVYMNTIFVAVWCTLEWLTKELEKYGCDVDLGSSRGLGGKYLQIEADNGAVVHIVWIESWDGTEEEVINLVHELDHLTFSILENACIKTNFDNSETHAYYQGWALRECYKILNGKKRRRAKK